MGPADTGFPGFPAERRDETDAAPAAPWRPRCARLLRSLGGACGGSPPLAAGLEIRGGSCVSPGRGWELSSRLRRGPLAPGSAGGGLKRRGGGFTGQQRASAGEKAAPSPRRPGGLA